MRIKVASKSGIPESEYSEVTFTTPAEQIMTGVTNLDYTAATINWTAGVEVTHVNLTFAGGAVQKIDISGDEKAAGSKIPTTVNNHKA